MPATALDLCLVIEKYQNMTAFWGNKRAGRGHDFPRRSLHLRIALGKLLERSSQNTDEMEVQRENRLQEGYPIGSGAP